MLDLRLMATNIQNIIYWLTEFIRSGQFLFKLFTILKERTDAILQINRKRSKKMSNELLEFVRIVAHCSRSNLTFELEYHLWHFDVLHCTLQYDSWRWRIWLERLNDYSKWKCECLLEMGFTIEDFRYGTFEIENVGVHFQIEIWPCWSFMGLKRWMYLLKLVVNYLIVTCCLTRTII